MSDYEQAAGDCAEAIRIDPNHTLAYVGHAENWDRIELAGDMAAHDCQVSYWRGGRKLAVAVIQRDLEGLRAELAFEKSIAAAGDPADGRN